MLYCNASARMNWRQRLVAVVLALGFVAVSAAAAMGAEAKSATKAPVTGTAKAEPAAKAPAAPAPTAPTATAPVEKAESGATDTAGTSQATVTGDGTIELHAKNEDLANLLDMISQKYNLNIIVSRGAKGRVTLDLYKATVDQALDAMCRANGLKWSREGNTLYVCTLEESMAARMDESRLTTQVFQLNYLSGEDATKLVAPALSSKAMVAMNLPSEKGIASGGSASTGGNSFGLQDSLVIRDFPENIKAVREILARMDRRPRQVLVEATILQVKLNDAASLGVNFNTLSGINFKDLTQGSGSGSSSGGAGFPILNPGSVVNGGSVPASISPWGAIGTNFALPTSGLNIGVMTNNIAIFINALEEVADTTVLSNPKVLALNKQRAEVIVGKRLGYKTTTQTEVSTIQDVKFLDSGTQLIFRPFIGDDGFIRMEIHPKVSTGDVINDLPREETTEVTCNIMVKDGHTIVIGGMFDETASISRSQVPGLGGLPLIGPLFRNNSDTSIRSEIVVLLTPHIIDDVEVANDIGKQFLEDGKRHCLGLRESFACYTRERIGVGYLMEADRYWTKYQDSGDKSDLEWALWNVNLALGVGPNNLKAIRLKDRILSQKTGKPYEAPNWTIWDTLGERLQQYEQKKKAAPVPAAELKTPETPKAVTETAPAATKSVTEVAPAEPAKTEPRAPRSAPWPVAMTIVHPMAESEDSATVTPASVIYIKEMSDDHR
jgi:type IV pilus assembly protein PilQ